MNFYLLNLKLSGIKNIDQEISIDFYQKTVNKNFNPEKYRVKAIYGENGAGKSAIVTAVKILHDVVINYRYLNDNKNQEFLSHIINKNKKRLDIKIDMYVGLDPNIIYKYHIILGLSDQNECEIQFESLSKRNANYSNAKWKTVFQTENGILTDIDLPKEYRQAIDRMTMNLLSSRSLPSIIFQSITRESEKKEAVKIVLWEIQLMFFMSSIAAINVYLDEEDQHERFLLKNVFQKLKHNDSEIGSVISDVPGLEDYVNTLSGTIPKSDFEKYEKKIKRLYLFLRIFKPELKNIIIDKKENGDSFVCELNLDYEKYLVNLEFESTGIKKLVRLFDCFNMASQGFIVFIDELDSNINDIYLCKLLEYFMYYGKGQLCFTTHNPDPMTILKENYNSIDFLSGVSTLVPWVNHGNASPVNYYKNGMIADSPFNIDATDFIGILGEE